MAKIKKLEHSEVDKLIVRIQSDLLHMSRLLAEAQLTADRARRAFRQAQRINDNIHLPVTAEALELMPSNEKLPL